MKILFIILILSTLYVGFELYDSRWKCSCTHCERNGGEITNEQREILSEKQGREILELVGVDLSTIHYEK
jgi:hypothetical protein